MIEIPAGTFMMGCNYDLMTELDRECFENEFPYHEVYMDAYLIDKTEVTQAAYAEFLGTGDYEIPGCDWDPAVNSDLPVTCINWWDAKEYCECIGKSLCTEAQWEKAARGTEGAVFPWGNEAPTCHIANMWNSVVGMDCYPWFIELYPPCSRSPQGDSPYGLCDMSGNVAEWTADFYADGSTVQMQNSNPTGQYDGTSHVTKGGSLNSYDYATGITQLATSARKPREPWYTNNELGFRCCKAIDESP